MPSHTIIRKTKFSKKDMKIYHNEKIVTPQKNSILMMLWIRVHLQHKTNKEAQRSENKHKKR